MHGCRATARRAATRWRASSRPCGSVQPPRVPRSVRTMPTWTKVVAARRSRAGLGALARRDRGRRGDRVYVHAPDRLARRYAYQVLLVEEFRRAGVEVAFLN